MRFGTTGPVLHAEILERHTFGRRTDPAVARRRWQRRRCDRRVGTDSAAAVHQTLGRPERSRAVPDRVRADARIRGRPHRRASLHARDPRQACGTRYRAHGHHAARRLRHVRADTNRRCRAPPHSSRSHSIFPTAASRAIERARANGRRIVAVGTTTTRTLEHAARMHEGRVPACTGEADLFIYSRVRVSSGRRAADQLPSAAIVAARAGVGLRRPRSGAARLSGQPSRERYRFYSYGDAMLITLDGRQWHGSNGTSVLNPL